MEKERNTHLEEYSSEITVVDKIMNESKPKKNDNDNSISKAALISYLLS